MFGKRKNKQSNNSSLVLINLDNDYRKVKEKYPDIIKKYKEEIREWIKNKDYSLLIFSNLEKLEQEHKKITELLVINFINTDNIIEMNKSELEVRYLKLKLYLEKLEKLKKEVLCRLVSLKEISNKTLFIFKKERILNSIDNMIIKYQTLELSIKALTNEINSCLELIKNNSNNKENTSLIERLNKLLFITKSINNNLDNFISTEEKIAYLELIGENYVYNHKEESIKLKEELPLEDEDKILLFYYFGRNLINENEIKKFYEKKFNKLIENINLVDENPIKENDYGFEYYKKIIEDKILLLDQTYWYQKINDNYNIIKSIQYINYIKEYLKTKTNDNKYYYDYEEILKNKEKLSFLVSSFSEEKMIEFFDNIELRILSISIDNTWKNQKGIVLTKNIIYKEDVILDLIYKYIFEHNLDYVIPNGIVEIDFDKISEELAYIIDRRISNQTTALFPPSLRVIKGSISEKVYFKNIDTVILNNGLKLIGDSTFYNCKSLKNITIPESVTIIGNYAFSECKKLENITIPKKIIEIGYSTFEQCKSLKSIIIPEGVIVIRCNAFNECQNLTSIIIPESIIEIEKNAFPNCENLTQVIGPKKFRNLFPENVNYIEIYDESILTEPDEIKVRKKILK